MILPHFRLTVCLLVSFAAHGALFWHGEGVTPVSHPTGDAPVKVSLLTTEERQTLPEPFLTEPAEPPAKVHPRTNMAVAKPQPVEANRMVTQEEKPVMTSLPPVPRVSQAVDSEETLCVWQEPVIDGLDALSENTSCPPNTLATDATQQPATHAAQSAEMAVEDVEAGVAGRVDLAEAVPDYRRSPLPEYPYIARRKRWEGVVWLLVDVTADGHVEDLSIEESCGYGVLDRAALKTVRGWEFNPARRAGVPVASQVRIPVRFRLEGG